MQWGKFFATKVDLSSYPKRFAAVAEDFRIVQLFVRKFKICKLQVCEFPAVKMANQEKTWNN